MIDAVLLQSCKQGMNIPEGNTHFDGVLTQKILAVKSFMLGAGVSETMLGDDLSVSVIVLGVTDLWNLSSGEIKFSPVFYLLVNQLSSRSLPKAGER